MRIAIPIFEAITALDAVGPYEVLSRLPDAEVVFVAQAPGPKRTENGMLALTADASLSDVPDPEVIVVPGGFGTRALMTDEAMLSWLRSAHATSTWTTSVCTGSLLLAAAGLLAGRRAACHWAWRDSLSEFGVTPDPARVVRDGNVITGGGVTAGIDMALTVMAEIAGPDYAQTVQLAIEYAPAPPFDSGSVAKAPPEIVELVRARRSRLA